MTQLWRCEENQPDESANMIMFSHTCKEVGSSHFREDTSYGLHRDDLPLLVLMVLRTSVQL
jgi:hypothetical protein